VQRNRATVRPVPVFVTTASHTWVVRPACTLVAMVAIRPSRAVPRKFVFSSIVVKPLAPSGSSARVARPQAVSASPTTVAAWR
jgi:hypothetical protein